MAVRPSVAANATRAVTVAADPVPGMLTLPLGYARSICAPAYGWLRETTTTTASPAPQRPPEGVGAVLGVATFVVGVAALDAVATGVPAGVDVGSGLVPLQPEVSMVHCSVHERLPPANPKVAHVALP